MVPAWLISRLLLFSWCFSVSHLKLALCSKKYATVIRNSEKTVLTLCDAVSAAQIVPSLPYSSLYFDSASLSMITIIASVQSVQSLSRVRLLATPWITARQAFLSITNSRSWLKFMPIKSVMRSAISSSVVPFSSCPQSLPASGSFPMSQLFAWGGQSIGVSASASVLPMNTQDRSPSGWTGWISLV